MKIANKISLAFLATGIILTTLAGSIFYLIARSSLQRAIYAQLDSAIRSRKNHIETYLEMLKLSVGQLSQSVVLENFLKTDKESLKKNEALELAMQRLISTKLAAPYVYEFLLLDKTGKVVASSNETNIGLDKSSDAFFIGAQKEIYIKDAYYSEVLHRPLIAASAPMLDRDTNRLLGVIVARVELNDLYKIVTDTTGLGQTGEMYIVNKDGFMITPSRFLPDTFLKQKVDTLNFKNCQLHKTVEHTHPAEEKEGRVISPDYRGVMVLGTHALMPKMQWSLLADINSKEALAPIAKLRIVLLAILFLVPLAAWLTGVFISGLITVPLHRLHKGTEIIGAGNLDYKIATNAKDEIGQLSRAFDQMVEDLKKSQEHLKNWAGTLEAKVEERTKELSGVHEATLNILEDLTEAKKIAEDALRIKTDFTSTVSHELRTPLTAIKEGIGIVLDGTAGDINAEQKDFLNLAKRNVDRLTRLINDVLDLQKIEAGRMVFDLSENDINEVVREVRRSMLTLVEKKGLDFVLNLEENLPKAKFDRDKIVQVLVNLVNNAIKFTEKGGITITTGQGNNVIQVSVRDTGLGIEEKNIPKLFQQFEQLEKGGNRRTGGTGLGLAISKEIIQRHSGKIWAESEIGKGTRFYFVLPIQERRAGV